MTKIFQNVLMFFGYLFILQMITIGLLIIKSHQLDTTSAEYTAKAIDTIFGTWDYEALKKNADPTLFTGTDEAGMRATIKTMSALGKIKGTPECNGKSTFSFGTDKPFISAQYTCRVPFENDKAAMILYLIGNLGNNWKIGGLHVNSDYLVQQSQAQAQPKQ